VRHRDVRAAREYLGKQFLDARLILRHRPAPPFDYRRRQNRRQPDPSLYGPSASARSKAGCASGKVAAPPARRVNPSLKAPKFPASRELTGNFIDSGLGGASIAPKKRLEPEAYEPIPYAPEQGIFCGLAGNLNPRSGKFLP
jgi:hypothetical protein